MPRVVYPSELDEAGPRQSNIQGMMDALELAINNRFEENELAPGAIEHRHLDRHQKISLRKKANYPLTIGAVRFTIGSDSYREIEDLRLTTDVVNTSVRNRDGTFAQAIIVTAVLRTNGVVPSSSTGAIDSHSGTKFCLAYSADAGGTWIGIPASVRPAGWGCGMSRAFFSTQQQNHYMLKTAGWYPPSEPFDGRIVLTGAFGGSSDVQKFAQSQGDLRFGVFWNTDRAAPNYPNLFAVITANVRKPTD